MHDIYASLNAIFDGPICVLATKTTLSFFRSLACDNMALRVFVFFAKYMALRVL